MTGNRSGHGESTTGDGQMTGNRSVDGESTAVDGESTTRDGEKVMRGKGNAGKRPAPASFWPFYRIIYSPGADVSLPIQIPRECTSSL